MNIIKYIYNPVAIIKAIRRYIDFYLVDTLATIFLVIIFLLFPKKLFFFFRIRKSLNVKTIHKNILSHWTIKFPKRKLFQEINILLKGKSLNKSLIKINKSLPTFAVNIFVKPENFKKFYGITASENDRKLMIQKQIKPTFFVGRQIDKVDGKVIWSKVKKNNYRKKRFFDLNKLAITNKYFFPLPIGSGLAVIFTLEKIAKKINIYGSDHYLNKDINKYSFLNLLKEVSLLNGQSNIYGPRRRNFFLEAIINLYYIEKLIKLKKFNFNGNLKKLYTRKFLVKKLNNVFN